VHALTGSASSRRQNGTHGTSGTTRPVSRRRRTTHDEADAVSTDAIVLPKQHLNDDVYKIIFSWLLRSSSAD
jgi:hypothetical protein